MHLGRILSTLLALLPGALSLCAQPDAGTNVLFLGDHPELIISASQAWGELGYNVAAHQAGISGEPLKIGNQTWTKGLGHHANGTIAVLLEGRFKTFEAEVGLQPCPGGTVVFRVFVDGEQRFDSGPMRPGEAAKSLHVELSGAQELSLEANDAADGITCDMANWAEARLTLATSIGSAKRRQIPSIDIAPFGRVVTWDPHRLDGARASRIEEFRREDVYTETDLKPNRRGEYTLYPGTHGLVCIGLQWLNRRACKELALEFAAGQELPAATETQVQGWFGESAWQGNWKPLSGPVKVAAQRLSFRPAADAGLLQLRKVRWIFPARSELHITQVSALSRLPACTIRLRIEADHPKPNSIGRIALENGEFLGGPPGPWRMGARPVHLEVRCSRPNLLQTDPPVLCFALPTGKFGVAIADVLSNDCVYLPEHHLFVTRDPAPITLENYRREIAARRTVLEQVRALPDQTLERAMAKTHHDAQREGPVMLSLACDNLKFVVERDGTVRFEAAKPAADWFASAGSIQTRLGTGAAQGFSRRTEGWLPIPVNSIEEHGVKYQERVFVAPTGPAGADPLAPHRPSVCVIELAATNTQPQELTSEIQLTFTLPASAKLGSAAVALDGAFRLGAAGVTAMIDASQCSTLKPTLTPKSVNFAGKLKGASGARLAVFLVGPGATAEGLQTAPDQLHQAAVCYWKDCLAQAMQIQTPDPFLNDVIRSSQVRCLIAARNEADGTRIAPWIAAMSYGPLESEANSVIRGMDFLGHHQFAQRSLDFFLRRYNTNGFLTTGYTTFGTAWNLWTIGEHCQLNQDTEWLEKSAPVLVRAGHWIVKQTEKTLRQGAPESGLMPPGVMADWNAFACHYALNAYYYAALRQIGVALQQTAAGSRPAPENVKAARIFLAKAEELKANILRAYRWTQSRSPALRLRNGAWIPAYPSQVHSPGKLADFFPGQDGGRSWCYDVELGAHQMAAAGVLSPVAPEVGRMLDHMEDVQFLSDGWFDYPAAENEKDWFNFGGFSKVQPYYTRNCELYALRDDLKPFVRSYYNTLAAMLNPEVLTIWEHFHHSGAWDKTHETGYFLHQTRTMLVTERGDELWLAPLITSNWLHDGKRLAVANAPTTFGPVSYEITSHIAKGWIEVRVTNPTRARPGHIVLRLRHPEEKPIRSASVNGNRFRDFDSRSGLVRLKATGRETTLQVRY